MLRKKHFYGVRYLLQGIEMSNHLKLILDTRVNAKRNT